MSEKNSVDFNPYEQALQVKMEEGYVNKISQLQKEKEASTAFFS
jgi:hypothetical protein